MKYLKELEKGFFAFWVLRYKVTFLIAFVIAVFGVISLNNIPKESMPEVNLPMVTVTTRYDGVSAAIIDEDITEEIESSLEDIEGISGIKSTSSEGNSSITIEISDGYDIDDVISEIEDAVDSTNLPSGVDSDYPIVKQREFTSTDMFSTILYASEKDFNFEKLLDIAELVKQNTSSKNGIKEVTIDTNTIYDIRVILSKEKLDNLGISVDTISSTITNNNIDSPIGTYEINKIDYSFKLSGKIKDYNELLNLDILIGGTFKKLGDIADLELYYGEEKINKFGKYADTGYLYISLTYSKLSGSNIFDVAPGAKEVIEEEMGKSAYSGVSFYYTDDESQDILDDYVDLTKSASTTLFFVFIALIFFVGFRESVIATLILPLAFLLAFIVVNQIGETLNMMTTFAFVLAFGIAIDTIIIIIEGAAEKVKQGYNPRTAALIALHEYKSPIIIGTVTTVSAFIPILALPGMMGIMLSFIPKIIFITLISTLTISLLIASAMFVGLSKKRKTYEIFKERERVMNKDEKELLDFERQGKTQVTKEKKRIREKIYDKYSSFYRKSLKRLLRNSYSRVISTIIPFILLIVCIVGLVPNLGFEIFPSARQDSLRLTVKAPESFTPSDMQSEINFIEDTFSKSKEIKDYTLSISANKISVSLNLTPSIDRINEDLLGNEELQTYFTDTFNQELASKGYSVGASAVRKGPGGGDPVGIFLTTTNADNYNMLIGLAEDFEKYLLSKTEVSSVTLTSSDPIGEIEFTVDHKKAALLGLNEREVFNTISTAIRGKTVGSIKGVSNDHDVKLYIDTFLDNVTPSDIENINIYSGGKTIKAGSVIDYKITKTSPSIKRGDGDIQVGINAGLVDTSFTTEIQADLEEFAKQYDFPKGITYKSGGENVENADLINSVITGVFVAFFLIFAVLVYQFNSYGQPIVILYSVFMSMIGVTVGLYVTGNPLSMPAGIGFISLMGIVVNDAIVMIDKINKNIEKKMELKTSIIEGAVSRLNPVLVTTVTTVAGILPIALQDVFWAGLGFTIAFGLTTGSFMTLFAIPTLYYSLESRKFKNEQNSEYMEKQEENKERKKLKITQRIFNKKNLKLLLSAVIGLLVIFIGFKFINPVKENAAMTPEVQEIIQKVKSGEELTPKEQKQLQEFKAKKARTKSSGGGRGK